MKPLTNSQLLRMTCVVFLLGTLGSALASMERSPDAVRVDPELVSEGDHSLFGNLADFCTGSSDVRSDWLLPDNEREFWSNRVFFAQEISEQTRAEAQRHQVHEENRMYYLGESASAQHYRLEHRENIGKRHAKGMLNYHLNSIGKQMKTAPKSSALGKVHKTTTTVEKATKIKVEVDPRTRITSKVNVRTLSNHLKLLSPYFEGEFRMQLAPSLISGSDQFSRDNPLFLKLHREFNQLRTGTHVRYGFSQKILNFEWKTRVARNLYGVAGANSRFGLLNPGEDPVEGILRLDYRLSF